MEATRRSLLLSIPALIGFRGDVMSPRLETEIATLELTDLDGRRIRLAEFRGRVVLLYFWATWCAPSKAELPWLRRCNRGFGRQILLQLRYQLTMMSANWRHMLITTPQGSSWPIETTTVLRVPFMKESNRCQRPSWWQEAGRSFPSTASGQVMRP